MRKSFSTELVAKVALEAIKEEKTIAELSSQYGDIHRTQITNWRKRALEGLVRIFQEKAARTPVSFDPLSAHGTAEFIPVLVVWFTF